MVHLLKIKVSGFRMLPDDFTLDFTTKARVNEEECFDDSEIIKIDENLYSFCMIALTGSNSSGKTSTLDLISKVIMLMTTGRWEYSYLDFNKEVIDLYFEFYLDGKIYVYHSNILKQNKLNDFVLSNPYCIIKNENLKYTTYKASVGKRYLTLDFKEVGKKSELDDTSILIFVCKNKIIGHFFSPFSNDGTQVRHSFFESLRLFDSNLTMGIVRLLDDSIENIKYLGGDNVAFERFDEEERIISRLELMNQLSNGTIRGIELYVRCVSLLKSGGILLIDEIENCFHKNLVNNVLYLLIDKLINQHKAQVIFTTHYFEILDTFSRRDNIFILQKNNVEISIKNLYENFPIRTEILKSKQFNRNIFNTFLNYDKLMYVRHLIKEELKNEVSDND